MSSVRLEKRIKDQYENKIKAVGIDGLYKYVIGQGIINKDSSRYPEITLLDQSDAFYCLYKKDNNELNAVISRVLKRAAHKLYRSLQKQTPNYPINARFLNIVK